MGKEGSLDLQRSIVVTFAALIELYLREDFFLTSKTIKKC